MTSFTEEENGLFGVRTNLDIPWWTHDSHLLKAGRGVGYGGQWRGRLSGADVAETVEW